MTFINERTHKHNAIFHEALNKNIKGPYMHMNTDKTIMLCQWKATRLASSKWLNTLHIKEVVW